MEATHCVPHSCKALETTLTIKQHHNKQNYVKRRCKAMLKGIQNEKYGKRSGVGREFRGKRGN
jgi:hypothetical protein